MALEKMHFTTSDGEEIVVPYMMDAVKRKDLRRIQKEYKDQSEEMDGAMLEAANISKKNLECIDNLSMRDYVAFIKEWMEQEDAPLGKS